MAQAPFERLHPAVQHHIVNSLGWDSLRPTQEAAIDPILDGKSCILLAPTAGGKTEAATFPILSKILAEEWRGLSVLYVCPIRALLNNLEPRLSHYLGLVGRRVGVWHGDIGASAKQRWLREPPDLLLTTPESIEGMLIAAADDKRNLLQDVRLMVVDELHAFCGDDRGWHVRCLIHRLSRHVGHPLQVIGLTATVGNPQALIDWLVTGREAVVVGAGHAGTEAEIAIDYVGSLENAATVIARLHQGEKRLVFCDSRAKTEEIAALLRGLGVRTYVSHSSLSSDERRQAEKAFAGEPNCVIVATSTLELGIDVGDLDRVIQIDAPVSVASFLQRMGRTGRRHGALRNCLFLATNEEGLMIAGAIVRLWRDGFVESIAPPAEPWHLVGQQAMALVLQHGGIARPWLLGELAAMFAELDAPTIGRVIAAMVEKEILWDDAGVVGLGRQGESEFGRRHFEAIVSTFNSPVLLTVLHGQREIGFVDPMTMHSRGNGAPEPLPKLILGGRYWRVVSFDWKSRCVWVEPGDDGGKATWFGSARTMTFALCQTMKKILVDGELPAALSKRAVLRLDRMRADFPFLDMHGSALVREVRDGHAEWRWWTFAGGAANFVLADLAAGPGAAVKSYDNLSLRFRDPPLLESRNIDADVPGERSEKKLLALAQELKYSTCLPMDLQIRVLRFRTRDLGAAQRILVGSITRSGG